MKQGGDSCNAVLGVPGPGTSLLFFSYLKHGGLRDNQQDVRASISLLQGHQLIHGPWLSELEWGALPTHPALAVHIPELVELGSWFGQVAGCGKKSPETQYDSGSQVLQVPVPIRGGKVLPVLPTIHSPVAGPWHMLLPPSLLATCFIHAWSSSSHRC